MCWTVIVSNDDLVCSISVKSAACTFSPSISFLYTFFFSPRPQPRWWIFQLAVWPVASGRRSQSHPKNTLCARTSRRANSTARFRTGVGEETQSQDPSLWSLIHPSITLSIHHSLTPTQLHSSSFVLFLSFFVLSEFTFTAFVKDSYLRMTSI